MKKYAVAVVIKPYNEENDELSSFNLMVFSETEMKDYIYTLDDFYDDIDVDKLLNDIKNNYSYRFSISDSDFIVQKIK